MIEQQCIFIFKLRRNIALEGDLLLAYLEIKALVSGDIQELPDLNTLLKKFPQLSKIKGFGSLESHVREQGKQAYIASGKLELLPELIRRVSFIERIYCVTDLSDKAKAFLGKILGSLVGKVIAYQIDENTLVIQAVPYYALIEMSKVIANHSKGVDETKRNLDIFLDALLDRNFDKKATKLVNTAISAASTTSHLSHDIHYYKAKFFPRMVRSLLNICSPNLSQGRPRVIDNFVGSGTTILESSILGIPSVGLDIDPLSVMIARAKIEALNIESKLLLKEVNNILQSLENLLIEIRFGGEFIDKTSINFPAWLIKNRKMSPEIASNLNREINLIKTSIIRANTQRNNLFNVFLSNAISRKIRMRFMGTGVGRFSLTFAKSSLLDIFTKSLQQYVKVAAMCEWLKQTIHLDFAPTEVLAGDARQIPNTLGLFDMLITSPPYLPASSGRESYSKSRALSLISLGIISHEDLDNLVDESIGSMNGNGIDIGELSDAERDVVDWLNQDELRQIKAKPTAKYFLDIRSSFGEMYRVLRPGAKAVVISGKNSTFYQFSTRQPLYVVNTAEILALEAERAGFEVEALHDIKLHKPNKNARPRSLDDYYETLIMLKKPTN